MSSSPTSPGNLTGDILLDAGTNELEVLVFLMDGGFFGVNVAKVREVVRWVEPAQSPLRHASVLGVINLRGTVLPLVDLRKHLEVSGQPADMADRRIIVTEFNGSRCGFVVDGVEQIHRVSWQTVEPAPELNELGAAPGRSASTCTGVVKLGERMILMLDFESVSDEIASQDALHIDEVENEAGVDRGSKRVIIAEDSPFMREQMKRAFEGSGYSRVELHSDGQAAWEAIESGDTPDAIVSDIEMPRLDGLALTKLIRAQERFRRVPVILFSSLISRDNEKKGEQVGATVQIGKPELRELVRLVDRAVAGGLGQQAA
jgi:two-component system chemotaxis response regulator CheV